MFKGHARFFTFKAGCKLWQTTRIMNEIFYDRKGNSKRKMFHVYVKKVVIFERNTNKFSSIKSVPLRGREKRQEFFHIKKNSRLHFYDIKIKVYVKLRKRKSKRKEKEPEENEENEEREENILVDGW